jgi:hypothetical protein
MHTSVSNRASLDRGRAVHAMKRDVPSGVPSAEGGEGGEQAQHVVHANYSCSIGGVKSKRGRFHNNSNSGCVIYFTCPVWDPTDGNGQTHREGPVGGLRGSDSIASECTTTPLFPAGCVAARRVEGLWWLTE